MAFCKYCQQEMNGADGCVKMPVRTIDGPFDPIPYGGEKQHLEEAPQPGMCVRDVRGLLQLLLADSQAGQERQTPANRRDDGRACGTRLVVR